VYSFLDGSCGLNLGLLYNAMALGGSSLLLRITVVDFIHPSHILGALAHLLLKLISFDPSTIKTYAA